MSRSDDYWAAMRRAEDMVAEAREVARQAGGVDNSAGFEGGARTTRLIEKLDQTRTSVADVIAAGEELVALLRERAVECEDYERRVANYVIASHNWRAADLAYRSEPTLYRHPGAYPTRPTPPGPWAV